MPSEDIAAVVAGMSDDEKVVITALNDDWQAGPDLPEEVYDSLASLRDAGFLERQFGDRSKTTSLRDGGVHVALSACWWFRLSDTGLRVRAALMGEG